ncbi:MAG: PD-(D/E)XK nuclease-like domain-containing protein [Verrucomicrobiota bacterium]
MSNADIANLAPGIYYDMPYSDYHQIIAFRSSELREAAKSLLHYKRYVEQRREPSYALDFGKAFHVTLEKNPTEIIKAGPTKTAYTQKWLKAMEAEPETVFIQESDIEMVRAMQRGVLAHEVGNNLYHGAEHDEVVIVWVCAETGVRLKCRIDALTCETAAVDWKTTGALKLRALKYAIRDYGYDIQMAMIRDGLHAHKLSHRREFYNCFVEKTEHLPDVAVYEFEIAELNQATARYRQAIRDIEEARRTDYWPGICPSTFKSEEYGEDYVAGFGEGAA